MSKGIYFNKQYHLYHARVYRNGKNHHVGRFKTLREAEQKLQEFVSRYFND